MKTKILVGLIILASLFTLFRLLPVKEIEANPPVCDTDHKVYICHDSNKICVDKNSTAEGHGGHSDIIPEYTYQEWEVTGSHMGCPNNYSPSTITCPGRCYKDSQPSNASKCVDKVSIDDYGWVTHTFNAMGDQAVLANNCQPLPVDCEWHWSDCSVSCGGGIQTVVVDIPASNGGKECPTEAQKCNTDD
jgi:hypothetical protein